MERINLMKSDRKVANKILLLTKEKDSKIIVRILLLILF